jgi:putative flippase GtrA
MTWPRLGAPFKFVVVGIANTFVGLLAIYLCKWLLGFGDALANISGYMIGLAVSFLLNRGWTFRHSGAVLPALARFLVIFALAYLLNLATVLIAIHSFGVNSYLAQGIGIAPYTVFFYLGSKYFAFRPASARREQMPPPVASGGGPPC